MKTLIFTNLFPSRHEPIRGIFNLHRFKALSFHSEVRVVAPVRAWKRAGRPADWLHIPAENVQGIDVTYPTDWTPPRVARWHADMLYRWVKPHIRQLHKEFSFDAVLGAFAYPDVVVAARLAKDAGLPMVAVVMGSDINELATRSALRPTIKAALAHADGVIALSSALKDRLLQLGVPDHRIVVQRNGVDGTRFNLMDKMEARRTLGVPDDVRLACFVGNIVAEKGPDVLVDAVARLDSQELETFRAVFIGDGKLRESLEAEVERIGLRKHIRFLGRKAPSEVAVWMSAADVVCLPSRREGCPNVVLEGLASGRPVVASNVGGVPELLDDRNGIMVSPDDPLALAKAVTMALHRQWNPTELRCSVKNLSWDDSGKTFYEVISRATGRA